MLPSSDARTRDTRTSGHGHRRRPRGRRVAGGRRALDVRRIPVRLPDAAHLARPWRIHAIAPDFRLEDVWALPTPGGPDDFPRLVQQFASGSPSQGLPAAARILWALRAKIGGLLGWDDEED